MTQSTTKSQAAGAQRGVRLTVTPEQLRDGELCSCEACLRDGPHEPACPVHDEPPAACSCGRADQAKGAG